MNKQTDEAALTYEISDAALEAAGGALAGGVPTLIQGSYCFTCGQEQSWKSAPDYQNWQGQVLHPQRPK
jgi:hypothetical protein